MGEGGLVRPRQPRHQLPQAGHLVAEAELGRLDEVLVEGEGEQRLGQRAEVKLKHEEMSEVWKHSVLQCFKADAWENVV